MLEWEGRDPCVLLPISLLRFASWHDGVLSWGSGEALLGNGESSGGVKHEMVYTHYNADVLVVALRGSAKQKGADWLRLLSPGIRD